MTKETTGFSEICEKVFDAADLDNMAGIAIGILAGDKIYADARGFRNYETGAEMNADTVFHCASISKTFTSMGIMKLVDEEKLSLDARLVDLLPYLSIADKRCDKIKLHHMLSHISGLQDLEDLGWEAAQKEPDALKKHALSEEVRKVMMNTNPEDAVFAYTDLTYDLLA